MINTIRVNLIYINPIEINVIQLSLIRSLTSTSLPSILVFHLQQHPHSPQSLVYPTPSPPLHLFLFLQHKPPSVEIFRKDHDRRPRQSSYPPDPAPSGHPRPRNPTTGHCPRLWYPWPAPRWHYCCFLSMNCNFISLAAFPTPSLNPFCLTSALLIQQQRLEPDMILQGLAAKVILSSLRADEILPLARNLCEGFFWESVIHSWAGWIFCTGWSSFPLSKHHATSRRDGVYILYVCIQIICSTKYLPEMKTPLTKCVRGSVGIWSNYRARGARMSWLSPFRLQDENVRIMLQDNVWTVYDIVTIPGARKMSLCTRSPEDPRRIYNMTNL